jgi:hypothetical protein
MADSNSITRDEFADVMAAYMRGEMAPQEFQARTAVIENFHDTESKNIAEEMWYHYGGLKNNQIKPTCRAWEQLCRWLAFLQTDFGLVKKWPKLVRIPSIFPLLFLLILIASYGMSSRFCFMTWFWLGVVWSFMIYLRDQKNLVIRNNDQEFQQACRCAPFLSDDDWQTHKHLLDKYSLPQAEGTADEDNKCREANCPQTNAMFVAVVMIFLPLVLLFEIFSRQRLEHFRIFVRQESQEA